MERRKSLFENIFADSERKEEPNTTATTSQTYLDAIATNYNTINGSRSNINRNSLAAIWSYDDPMTLGLDKRGAIGSAGSYEPHDFGTAEKPTAFCWAVLHIVFLSANGGMFFIPYLFAKVGLAVGSALTIVIICCYAYNVRTIVWTEYEICKVKRIPMLTYPEAVFQAFRIGPLCIQWLAPHAQRLLYAIFIATWICGCVYVYVATSENVKFTFEYLYPGHIERRQIILLLFVPLLFLGMIRKWSYLMPLSVLAFIFHCLSFGIVVYYTIADARSSPLPDVIGSLPDVPSLLGTVLFFVNVTNIIIPLKNEMRYPKQFGSAFGVLTVSYVFVAVLMTSFSLLCAVKYGTNVKGIVTQNLPQDQILGQLANLFYLFSLLCMYPALLSVSFDIIWNKMLEATQVERVDTYDYILRIILGVIIFGISYAVPEVLFLVSISGTIGSSVDGIIFPAIIQTLVVRKIDAYKRKCKRIVIKNVIIAILGFVLMVAGIRDCLIAVFSYEV